VTLLNNSINLVALRNWETIKDLPSIIRTVQEDPMPCITTENWMAWGRASKRAAIQMANMNFTARDNLDIVCCLYRKQNQLGKFRGKIEMGSGIGIGWRGSFLT